MATAVGQHGVGAFCYSPTTAATFIPPSSALSGRQADPAPRDETGAAKGQEYAHTESG